MHLPTGHSLTLWSQSLIQCASTESTTLQMPCPILVTAVSWLYLHQGLWVHMVHLSSCVRLTAKGTKGQKHWTKPQDEATQGQNHSEQYQMPSYWSKPEQPRQCSRRPSSMLIGVELFLDRAPAFLYFINEKRVL